MVQDGAPFPLILLRMQLPYLGLNQSALLRRTRGAWRPMWSESQVPKLGIDVGQVLSVKGVKAETIVFAGASLHS